MSTDMIFGSRPRDGLDNSGHVRSDTHVNLHCRMSSSRRQTPNRGGCASTSSIPLTPFARPRRKPGSAYSPCNTDRGATTSSVVAEAVICQKGAAIAPDAGYWGACSRRGAMGAPYRKESESR